MIPTGVAHGFLALEPLELLYLVTNEYDGSDELGFAWDDPAVGVPWPNVTGTPDGRPILSDRDMTNPLAGGAGRPTQGVRPGPLRGRLEEMRERMGTRAAATGDQGAMALGTLSGLARARPATRMSGQSSPGSRVRRSPRPVRSMFRAAVGAAVAFSAVVGPFVLGVPSVAAAGSPKVVIVVGPVGSTTDSYRSDADAAAAEAAKYTPNVVKLYSPNATWDVVKPALQGASIVIYMGHGNGFPSPYSTTLQRDRQDGFGLNPTAGGNDSTTKYWGEQYVASDVKLAPNAVVILGHLCYASGSSEPGKPEPTLDQAKQRVDNFAAGFFAAGARAVIAEAYNGSARRYVTGLFTGHTTVGSMWSASSSAQGAPFSFASNRTPGMTAQMDPDHSSGKYWRSIVGDMNLSTDAVVGESAPASTPTPTPGQPTPTPAPSPNPRPPPDADAPDRRRRRAARPRRRHRPTTARSISRAPASP